MRPTCISMAPQREAILENSAEEDRSFELEQAADENPDIPATQPRPQHTHMPDVTTASERPQRTRKKPSWLDDYVTDF